MYVNMHIILNIGGDVAVARARIHLDLCGTSVSERPTNNLIP